MPAKPKAERPPRQANSLPTLKAWLASDINRERIAAILEDPVFRAACHYVGYRADITGADVNAAPDAVVRKAFYAAGLRAFTAELATLARQDVKTSETLPYDYIHPKLD